MIKFKSCPKCGQGDLILGQDIYGRYEHCFQCGHLIDLEIAEVRAAMTACRIRSQKVLRRQRTAKTNGRKLCR